MAHIRSQRNQPCLLYAQDNDGGRLQTSQTTPKKAQPINEGRGAKRGVQALEARLIYPISESAWVSPVQVVPKKGGMIVIQNEKKDLIPTRTITGWRICIDYRKLNEATRKDHFPLPFVDQMLERLTGQAYYYFLDGYSRYNQIVVDPNDQEKMTFAFSFCSFNGPVAFYIGGSRRFVIF